MKLTWLQIHIQEPRTDLSCSSFFNHQVVPIFPILHESDFQHLSAPRPWNSMGSSAIARSWCQSLLCWEFHLDSGMRQAEVARDSLKLIMESIGLQMISTDFQEWNEWNECPTQNGSWSTWNYEFKSILSVWSLGPLLFSERVARVPVSLWESGGWGCVRSTLRLRPQPFTTVRNRPQVSAWGPPGRAFRESYKSGHLRWFQTWCPPRFAWQAWHCVTFQHVW